MRGFDNLYADKWYGLTIYTLTNDMIRQSIHGYNGMIRPSIHEYNGMGWQSIHGQIKLENPYTNISTRLGVRALYHTFSDLNFENPQVISSLRFYQIAERSDKSLDISGVR